MPAISTVGRRAREKLSYNLHRCKDDLASCLMHVCKIQGANIRYWFDMTYALLKDYLT